MDINIKDRWLNCQDCGVEFCFRIEEQKWYQEKGFSAPKRCPSCAKKKRASFNNVKEAH